MPSNLVTLNARPIRNLRFVDWWPAVRFPVINSVDRQDLANGSSGYTKKVELVCPLAFRRLDGHQIRFPSGSQKEN